MKKLMIGALLGMSMQMQGYTIAKVGKAEVKGYTTNRVGTGYRVTYHFSLTENGEYAEFSRDERRHKNSIGFFGDTLSLRDKTTTEIALDVVKNMTDVEKQSPFTICIINADATPITVSWSIDKDGAVQKQYEQEKDKQIKQRIEASVKGAGEGERKAAAVPS